MRAKREERRADPDVCCIVFINAVHVQPLELGAPPSESRVSLKQNLLLLESSIDTSIIR